MATSPDSHAVGFGQPLRAVLWSLVAAGSIALVAAPVAAAPPPREDRSPAEALAFVRVIADVRIDFAGVRPPIEREGLELATGSGFVVGPSGLVLTSEHVVAEGEPDDVFAGAEGARVRIENRRIEVVIGDDSSRRVLDAWVAASDPELDLAALQVTAADLPYLPMGDSDAAEAGRSVQVLGFPFGRQVEVARGGAALPKATVTAGSVSAAREDEQGDRRFLQTDASVNPGSSGGPMLDEDGYVVGLVRMKLSKGATGAGPGFAVTVNVVKDFLEAHGLLAQLPVGRLRPGVLQTYDWKAMRLEAPDGFTDSAASRLRLELGEIEGIDARTYRLPTRLPAEELDEALLRVGELPGFVPAPATARPAGTVSRRGGGASLRLGSAEGETEDHVPFRVEYAVLAWKDEVVVARYLGHPDAIAFNLSLVRRSLASLDGGPMPVGPPRVPVARSWDPPNGGFATIPFASGEGPGVPVPAGWSVEPAGPDAWRPCLGGAPRDGGLVARHPGAYAVVLRAWRLDASAADEKALAGCASSRRFQRLGVAYHVVGTVVTDRGERRLLELEAPVAAWPLVEGALERWAQEVAGPPAGR